MNGKKRKSSGGLKDKEAAARVPKLVHERQEGGVDGDPPQGCQVAVKLAGAER